MGAAIWDLYLLLKDFDPDAVSVNYDIGHAYCVGDDPAQCIPRVAKYVQLVTAPAWYLAFCGAWPDLATAADEKGRQTVYSLLPKGMEWIAPVGRLDKASEGLLLLTNDSEWAARITDPETHLDKTYHVQVGAVATEGMLERLRRGVETERGELLRTKRATIVRAGEKNSWIELVLDEVGNVLAALLTDPPAPVSLPRVDGF